MEVMATVNFLVTHNPFNTALSADCKSDASDDLCSHQKINLLVSFMEGVMLLVFMNQLVAPLK